MKSRVASPAYDLRLEGLIDFFAERLAAQALAEANRGARKRSPAGATADTATDEAGADGSDARPRGGTMT